MDNFNYLQALFDSARKEEFNKRSQSGQMTLGKLINTLECIEHSAVVNLSRPHSYRGYYSDLAVEVTPGTTVRELLEQCRAAMGDVFEGWKGGEYVMHKNTPVWVSPMGSSSGDKLMAINPDGSYITEVEER